MWTAEELIKKIQEQALLTEGSFKLRSGQTSSFYFDKYRFESDPKILFQIAQHLKPLIPPSTDRLAGLELGGIPLATALSMQTGIPCVFVRKQAKEYGTQALAEGGDFQGKNLLIIEDVITTGGQVIESADALREQKAIVENVLCVIHRKPDNENPKLKEARLNLKALFNLSHFDHPLLKTK